VRFDQHGRLVV